MSLSYALLGFLNYTPLAGYDIKKILDDSTNFFWSAQTSQIYRELKVLEQQGYIVSELKSSDKGPDKRIYSITESGLEHLKNWLFETHTSEIMRNEFAVWLLFSSHVGLEELYSAVKSKLKEYKKEYESLKLVENKLGKYLHMFSKEDEDFYWKIVLTRGKYDVEAKIRWAEDTLETIKSKIAGK